MSELIVSVSGVRGVVGRAMRPETGVRFGCAFASFLGSGKRVVLGRDSRPSGPMLHSAVAAGLLSCGVNVVDLGLVTTPGAALMVRWLGCDGGVVVTASHNPIQYNGIKFVGPEAMALSAERASRLAQLYHAGDFAYADSLSVGTVQRDTRTHAAHVQKVLEICDVTLIASKRFKVVLDSINGAGCVVTPMLLSQLGCELVHINAEPTGRFAHRPEPLAENLSHLCEQVSRHRAAVGFAQDPDADRLALVDETGRYVGEEYTLALAVRLALSKRRGPVAANLATSRMIDELADRFGVQVIRTPVGEANVAAAVLQHDCVIGGEGNGGVIDPRVVPVRDSLVAMAMILQLMAETNKPLSALVDEIPRYEIYKTKFDASAGDVPQLIEQLATRLSPNAQKLDRSDGLRLDFADGWVLVRPSNTEPIVRVIAEADTADKARAHAQRVLDIVGQVRGGGVSA